MSLIKNPQTSCQLVNWAIKRVLELRVNRAIKRYSIKDVTKGKFSGWSRCDKCGNLYKVSCKSCAGKIVRAKKKNAVIQRTKHDKARCS